jgi:hypothetical protein
VRGFLSKVRAGTSSLFAHSITPVLAISGAGLFSFAIYTIYPAAGLAVGAVFLLFAAYDSST